MSKPFGTPLKIVDPDNVPSEFTDNILESLNAICETNTSYYFLLWHIRIWEIELQYNVR